MAKDPTPPTTGQPVDSHGWPAEDPTSNVRALQAAGERRQDDLRAMATAHMAENIQLRADCASEISHLRDSHYHELRKAEADRIDAIRAVDVQAVQRAAEVQLAQATALATQVSVSAETLRAQVAAAQSAAAVSLAAALGPIQEAVADLRRVQYEQQGQKASLVETKSDRSSGFGLILLGVGIFFSSVIGIAAIILTLS